MKKIIGICIIVLLCIGGCTPKHSDFVIDPTLEREYLEDSTNLDFMPHNWNGGEVNSAQVAFSIVEPILIDLFSKEEVEKEKPFSINLIDNEIWVINGALHQPKGEIIMGGTKYVEIRKKDGRILKIIQGE